MKLVWMGFGGNRYLIERLFEEVLIHLQDIQLTIISEWDADIRLINLGIIYKKWKIDTWAKDCMEADVILCPQNPIQPAKSHVKVIYAFALKKPVICSHHPAYEEIVEDGVNGYFYNKPEDLIDIIDKLKDKDVRIRMGQAGYDKIIKQFSTNNIVSKLVNYVMSDLSLDKNGIMWQPSIIKSGLRWSQRASKPVTVDIVYVPLLEKYHSYGDFLFDALQNVLGVNNVNQHNTLENLIEYRNKTGWNMDFILFVEFNVNWYNIPKEILHKSIMFGWDTHSHFMFSHLYGLCRRFKRVYLTGKADVERIEMLGYNNVKWIPEAYSKDVHKRKYNKNDKLIKRFCFAGQVDNVIRNEADLNRADYINEFIKRYKDRFVLLRNFYGKKFSEIMSNFMLTIDFPIAHNIGTRMFESNAMGVKAIRLDNKAPGFDEYFKNGENVILVDPLDKKQLYNEIDMYLASDNETVENESDDLIGYSEYQSYDNRIKYILEDLGL